MVPTLVLFCGLLVIGRLVVSETQNEALFFVSTTQRSHEPQESNKFQEISNIVTVMNRSANYLEEIKTTMAKIENSISEKIKIYSGELENIKNELLSTQKDVRKQMKEFREEILTEIKKPKLNIDVESERVQLQVDGSIDEVDENLETGTKRTELQPKKTLDTDTEKIKQQRKENQTKISFLKIPTGCAEIKKQGIKNSSTFVIRPRSTNFKVFCDMRTHGGGWAYILKRFDGSQNFDFNWTEYRVGFGNFSGEFWLGLEFLYQLTYNKPTELLFELKDRNSKKAYAYYNTFQIGNESEGYYIKNLGAYNGNAGDSFRYHVGSKFSTPDKDQDQNKRRNCARFWNGSWWYSNCFQALPTGRYPNTNATRNYKPSVYWIGFRGYTYDIVEVKMMVR